MFFKVHKFKILMAFLVVPFLAFAQPPSGWEIPTPLSFQTHTIVIPDGLPLEVNGITVENGDWLGVFYYEGGQFVCGGNHEVGQPPNNNITAYGDLGGTFPGFSMGDAFNWKFYDSSTGEEYFTQATYSVGGNTFEGGSSTLAGFEAAFAIAANADPSVLDMAADVDLSAENLDPANFTVAPDDWVWNDGMGNDYVGKDVTVFVDQTTTFTVTATTDAFLTATASVTVTLATVFAGDDAEVCSDPGTYELADAMVSGNFFPGVSWSTAGDGMFDNATAMNPVYTAGAQDLLDGTVTLTLTAVGPGGPVTDDVVVTYADPAEVLEFPDEMFLCVDANATPVIEIADFTDMVVVENYSLIQWSTTNGQGQFTNEETPEPTYGAGDADLNSFDANGQPIILQMQVFSNLPCETALSYQVDLYFVRIPEVVEAGAEAGYCIDPMLEQHTFADADVQFGENPYLPNLDNQIKWTTDNGTGTFDDDTAMQPTYFFSDADKDDNKVINFTLTVETMEACGPIESTTSISLQLPVTADVGPDATICEDQSYSFVGIASAENFSIVQWSNLDTPNSTGFSDENIVDPIYTPEGYDFVIGCATLQMNASPINPCINGASDQMVLCFQMNPVVVAGDDATICANETYTTDPTVENSEGPYQWTQVGGAGQLLNDTELEATYVAVNPTDVGSTVFLTLEAAAISPCTVATSATMELYIACAPNVNAGVDQTVCETENPILSGTAECVSETMWATTGDGYFCCPDDLTTTYYPGPMDKEGCVTLVLIGYPEAPCELYELDKVVVCFDPAPMASAGPDLTVCEGESIQLDGTTMDVCGIQWFVFNGSGSFDDEYIEDPIYTPNGQDLIAGTVQLIITGAPCGACTEAAMDTMNLTIQPLPVVEIAEDEVTICQDQMLNTCDLTLTVENETAVEWTTASTDGMFAEPTMLCTTYTPGSDEINGGFTVLTLTAAPTLPCTAFESDEITLNIQLLPSVVIAPADTLICETDTLCFTDEFVTYSDYDIIQWTTLNGIGEFLGGETIEYPCYVPEQQDITQGFTDIKVFVSPLSPCGGNGMSDTLRVYWQLLPTTDLVDIDTICADSPFTPDTYTVEDGCGLTWLTAGDGEFDNINAQYPVYTPGVTDKANGGVMLTLAIDGCADCEVVEHELFLSIQAEPTADAGDGGAVCEFLCNQNCPPYDNGIFYDILGEVTNASSFYWESDGDGMFIPSNEVLDPDYMLGDGDIADPDMEVELCLTAVAIDPCTVNATDCITITIQPFPVANAGDDQSICEGDDAQLDGEAEYEDGVFWDFALFGEGDGSWSSQIVEDPIYTPGDDDRDRGYVELIMVAFPTSPCLYPDADNMTVFIIPQPIADAGAESATVCAGETLPLNGSVTNATGGFYWETDGDGTFDPTNEVLDAIYVPGPLDITDGTVELCLYALDGSACQSDYFDCLTLTILPPPEAFAGDDAVICEGDSYPIADATALNYSTVEWTTNGAGTFDDITSVNPTYTPDASEFGTTVTLCMEVFPTDPCTASVTDCMDLTINNAPAIGFCFDGDLAATGSMFEYCFDETVTVSICEVWAGVGPFDVCYQLNQDPEVCVDDVAELGELFSGVLPVGMHTVQITSITDANGCTSQDVTPYMAYVTVHPEPDLGFCVNGDGAGYGDMFEFCYDQVVTVDVCEVLAGEGPFEVCWSLNGAAAECATVDAGGVLYNDLLPVGDNTIELVSITDANGCVLADPSLYTMTITILPEPDANFCVNGDVAGYGEVFEFCYDETVVVDMCEILSGTGPFEVCWTLDAGMVECMTVDEGGILFNDMLAVGTHEIVLTSITDANGCVLADPSLYTMTIVINEEPDLGFCVNGDGAGYGDMFEFCYDQVVTVDVCEVLAGEGPFEVCWSLNGAAAECATVDAGGVLYNDLLPVGDNTIELVSITDANGCVLADPSLYTMTITILPEPDANFCVNGDVAGYGDVFEFCYDETVVVDMCEILSGTGPFEVCWTLDAGMVECMTVDEGGILFNDMLAVGTHEIVLTSITDANGCVLADPSLYTMTIVVNEEPDLGFCVNGDGAGYGDMFEFCYDQVVTVDVCEVLAGEGPFEVCWSLNGAAAECATVDAGGVLYNDLLPVGDNTIELVSITDANGCVLADPSLYTMTITINEEPDLGFCVNGDAAGYGDVFEFCYDQVVTVDVCEVLAGEGPFEVCWSLNGAAAECATVDAGGVLYNDLLPVGDNTIELVSITDANGCVLADPSLYTMTITINEEPDLGFCVNGDAAGYGDVFEFCYDQVVTVDVCEVLAGEGPFEVCWSLNGAATECATVDAGELLYNDLLPLGDNTIELVSITDANGCVLADPSLYTMTITINPEPVAAFCFNGDLAATGSVFEYCETTEVDVTLCQVVEGLAPFTVDYTVNGDATQAVVSEGGSLFTDMLAPGTYEIAITSIVDANGCMVADVSPYMATVNIQAEPTVSAGDDQETCEEIAIQLTGTAEFYSSVEWSGGAGMFDPADDLVTTYTPAVGETGDVTLTLTASPIAPCLVASSDDMILSIQAAPTAFAGDDEIVCEGDLVALTGTAANYSAVEWTGGTGTFDPADELMTTYTPGAGEVSADLCLTAQPIGPCTVAFTDCLTLTVSLNPVVNVGDDMSECMNVPSVDLDPVVSNYATLEWTTSGDGFFQPGPNVPNPTYFFGLNDKPDGVTLTLTAQPNDPPCVLEVSDFLVVTFVPEPIIEAGDDATICESTEFYCLDNTMFNYSSIEWASSGNGTFDDDTAEDVCYYPADGETGSIDLTVTAYPLPGCDQPAVQIINLFITPDPVITPEGPMSLNCDNYDFVEGKWLPIDLCPTVIGGESYMWTSSGTGTFGNFEDLCTNYEMSAVDTWSNMITLTLTVEGPDNCQVSDTEDFIYYVPQQIINVDSVGTYRRGISSYVNKDTTSVAVVMDPVVVVPGSQSLVIMLDRTGDSFWPVPVPPINTLGDWEAVGYQAKFEQDIPHCLPIYGDVPYDTTDRKFFVDGPYTYLPVLTNRMVNIRDLFAGHLDGIYLIYDWYTKDIWQPEDLINPLEELVPGNAYLMINREGADSYEITFPSIDLEGSIAASPALAAPVQTENTGPWNDVINTGQPHFIFFAEEVMSLIEPGDVIGAFNQYNECVGVSGLNNREEAFRLLAMGDDPVTEEIDGFESGEFMSFKLYRSSTDETFDVTFTYDAEYPSYDNMFALYGVSKVTNMSMVATSISDGFGSKTVNVFPNPASHVINIASDYNIKSVSLTNYVGQMVYSQDVNAYDFQINVSSYVTGMYIVSIETTEGKIITKRISVE